MATFEEARDALSFLMDLFQGRQDIRFALTGDGTGEENTDVASKPGWTWVRYDDNQSRVSTVFNIILPGIPPDIPVLIGKRYSTDNYVQILGINWPLYFQQLNTNILYQYVTPKHGPTHNAVTGGDPAYMDIRNILAGRVRPTDVLSLSVFVEQLVYEYGGELKNWLSGEIDLTSFVPVAVGMHRYVLVMLDCASNTLTTRAGALSPATVPPTVPECPSGFLPLAAIALQEGQTEIGEDSIYDYRILFAPVGNYSHIINVQVGSLEMHLQEQIDTLMGIIQRMLRNVVDAEAELDRLLTVHKIEG